MTGVLARTVRPVALASVLVLLSAPASFAWHQLVPPSGTDAVPCQNMPTSPCVEWPTTSGGLSINVDVYLSYLLSQQEIDLKTDVRNAFPHWNNIAARNPHLQETTSTSNEEIWVTAAGPEFGFAPYHYGYTDNNWQADPPWRLTSSVIRFNTQIVWNRSYDYHCTATQCWADARKVATHEFGHAEGMGHVLDPTIAIMRQGEMPYDWTRVDDHTGIQAVHGAYP